MPDSIVRPVELSDCAREPIHVPGFIQTFGVLLAKRAGTELVSQISNNAELIFGRTATDVVGRKLGVLLGAENASRIGQILDSGRWKESNPIRISIDRQGERVAVNAIVHRYDSLDFVELELISDQQAEIATHSFNLIQSAMIRIQASLNASDLWETVVDEAQRITGYDRVMLYKFDRDNHGTVIAERKQSNQTSFLGLHYPASDIPEQARLLYRVNWVRYIPDVAYRAVPIIPVVDEVHQRLTDLTHSILRSVSPIHCEYLRNMGVSASMSVSILREGRLWGLIAIHNDTPKHIPFELRAACEFLGHVLSIRIAALEDTEDNAYRSKTNALLAKLLAQLSQQPDLATALVAASPNLLDFIPATGAAVCFGNKLLTLGRVPEDETIRAVMRGTLGHITAPIFVTDRLQERLPGARGFTDTASGVLCFTVSRVHDLHVFWFRTEQVQSVEWGGEPTDHIEMVGDAPRVSPRKSFEKWKQEVYGRSLPWLATEIEAAAELRSTLMSILLDDDSVRTRSRI
jgi:chemotaxis family two-component system sensor kinase Cph1